MGLWMHAGLLVIVVAVGLSRARPQSGVADFNIPFQNMLLLGNTQTQNRVYRIAFRPEDGLKNRVRFQEKHGKFGERLIASFGQGISPAQAQTLKPEDQIVNRNNWTGRDKNKHQYYFTAISYDTTTTPSASSPTNNNLPPVV